MAIRFASKSEAFPKSNTPVIYREGNAPQSKGRASAAAIGTLSSVPLDIRGATGGRGAGFARRTGTLGAFQLGGKRPARRAGSRITFGTN